MGGDAGALGPDGLLRHLHDDLLTLLDQGLDPRRRALAAVATTAAAARPRVVLVVGVRVELAALVQVIPDIEERSLFQSDVHEGGLHAREHPGDLPLRDHAGHVAVVSPLDVQLGEALLLDERDPGLPGTHVDDDLVGERRAAVPSGAMPRS